MKKLTFYQIDSFTNRMFSGNPAGVCLLDNWLDDDLMQFIAMENNLAETGFVVPRGEDFEIRWFTPAVEVDLCGHVTLATGYLLFTHLGYQGNEVKLFSPRSGWLSVIKHENLFLLDFPSDSLQLHKQEMERVEIGIGIRPRELYRGKTDFIAVLNTEEEVRLIHPDLRAIAELDGRGLIVTAPGDAVDFVSRFFAPQSGIDEDPVTGSAHTSLTPLWSHKLGKTQMQARQLSSRGGEIYCEYHGDRCRIGGQACLYLRGELYVDADR